MHHCLRVPEILQLICNEVDCGDCKKGHWSTRRSQLLALAQTCQKFQRPALENLWKFIPDITPVIKCAGRDLWKVSNDDEHSSEHYRKEFELARLISPSDAAIMQKYGYLVQCYGQKTEKDDVSVALAVWEALQHVFAGTTLFPNLRVVGYFEERLMQFDALFCFANLTSVTLGPSEHSELVNFSTRCPRLTSLHLDSCSYETEDTQAIVDALSNWPNLSRFVSRDGLVTPEFTRALSHCTKLRSVNFGQFFPDDDIPCLGTAPLHFPMLKEIKIEFDIISDAIQFFESLSVVDGLRKLSLAILEEQSSEESPKEEDWMRLLESLEGSSHSLEKLKINELNLYRDPSENVPLSDAFFSALADGFPALTHVELAHLGGYDIADQDIELLTEALPHLREFRLYNRDAHEEDACSDDITLTIACLTSFARNCPFITFLAIMFNATAKKISRHLRTSGQGLKLTKLNVLVSPIYNPRLVADFIRHIFPNLVIMSWDCDKIPAWSVVASRLGVDYEWML